MRGSKKAGPVKKRAMRGGGAAKKAGPVKRMRSGGRNLRSEEARVIGVQDNAADETVLTHDLYSLSGELKGVSQ